MSPAIVRGGRAVLYGGSRDVESDTWRAAAAASYVFLGDALFTISVGVARPRRTARRAGASHVALQ